MTFRDICTIDYSLNSLKGVKEGTTKRIIKGDTRSLDNGPYEGYLGCLGSSGLCKRYKAERIRLYLGPKL